MQRTITDDLLLFSLLASSLLAIGCGAPDTRVSYNTTPPLAETEGFLALTLKTTHGVKVFLKDRATGQSAFLFTPMASEQFAVHKLAQGRYCIDKIDWTERTLNGSPPRIRLNRVDECVEVFAGKLSYGGRWDVSLSAVGEMRVTSTLDMKNLEAQLAEHYPELTEKHEAMVPTDAEWTFDFLNR